MISRSRLSPPRANAEVGDIERLALVRVPGDIATIHVVRQWFGAGDRYWWEAKHTVCGLPAGEPMDAGVWCPGECFTAWAAAYEADP